MPEIVELETGGLCDVRQGDCSIVKVYGQGFKNAYELKCEFVKEKVLVFMLLFCFLSIASVALTAQLQPKQLWWWCWMNLSPAK